MKYAINSLLKIFLLFEKTLRNKLETYIEPEQQLILPEDLLPTISSQNLLQHYLWLAMVSAGNRACSVRPAYDVIIY
jgi:hypothetical protein